MSNQANKSQKLSLPNKQWKLIQNMLLKACAGEEMLWASLTASQINTANTPLYLFIWEGNFQSYCGVFLFKEVTSFHQSHRESLTCMGLSNKVSEPTGLGELLQSNESKQHDSRVGLRALEREERGDRKKWSSVCVLHQFFSMQTYKNNTHGLAKSFQLLLIHRGHASMDGC